MSRVNATLTRRTRLRLACLIVEQGWTHTTAAKMFMVATKTAKKWADRYRAEGAAGMIDRSSRPHHSPNTTSDTIVRHVVRLRWRQRLGPVQIAGRLGLSASAVHAVLARCRINRLSHLDRVTGEPLRRYEHAIGVLGRAVTWFAERGVTVQRVLSDNGSCYRSRAWQDACAALTITPKRTRPYRPQTNGKIERFHRTLAEEWAYARLYDWAALPGWLHFYHHHRAHSALGGQPPITRLTNLPGHHS